MNILHLLSLLKPIPKRKFFASLVDRETHGSYQNLRWELCPKHTTISHSCQAALPATASLEHLVTSFTPYVST
jgi:hypothetical protein